MTSISVFEGPSTPDVSVESDSYIALTARWLIPQRGDALHMFVRDPVQGYVELTVDSVTGELTRFVVIDEPRSIERQFTFLGKEPITRSTIIDLGHWPWKKTPDYVEPISHDVDMEVSLGMTTNTEYTCVWFSDAAVTRLYKTGTVCVGVSAAGQLALIAASRSGASTPGDFGTDK